MFLALSSGSRELSVACCKADSSLCTALFGFPCLVLGEVNHGPVSSACLLLGALDLRFSV